MRARGFQLGRATTSRWPSPLLEPVPPMLIGATLVLALARSMREGSAVKTSGGPGSTAPVRSVQNMMVYAEGERYVSGHVGERVGPEGWSTAGTPKHADRILKNNQQMFPNTNQPAPPSSPTLGTPSTSSWHNQNVEPTRQGQGEKDTQGAIRDQGIVCQHLSPWNDATLSVDRDFLGRVS